ncbi:HNH endonuclease [Paraburkholderia sp. GAS32]|uniref:HNH endonuclease n=1 Tax=Paraburkholderia sp. GAS32 TaxID=3035129 RepID=UPI003D23FFB8
MDRATEESFTQFLLEKARVAQDKAGIDYKAFERLLNVDGSANAVGRLMSRRDYTKGFLKLLEAGCLELTVEALVVESEWRQHFSQSLLDFASKKLSRVGYICKEFAAPAKGAESVETGERLSVATLSKATPEFIWRAVQMYDDGYVDDAYGPSLDYDLISEQGNRLPPKAIFGLALSLALDGRPIEPKHFSGGEASPCVRLLREAGFEVIPKNAETRGDQNSENDESTFEEGRVRLRLHRTRERAQVSKAKKAQFLRLHGKLTCERCGCDPVAAYGTADAEACIEVHHAATQMSEMKDGHKTKLEDLQCLCANCHRLVHRELAAEKRFGNAQ